MCHRQKGGLPARRLFGQLEIIRQFPAVVARFLSRESPPAPAQSGDLRPHEGAVREIKRKDGQARVVARPFQVAIQKSAAQVVAATVVQVHRAKGNFAGHVDPTQVVVEFNAVKNRDRVVRENHVSQVHVAVAFADEAGSLPR